MNIENVFKASSVSCWDQMVDNGVGFYIPAYQRGYSWGNDSITRLLDDAGHGLANIINDPDSLTFIGTIILIHDTENRTVDPKVKGQLPGKVLLVIDGQQRLATILITNIILHNLITMYHHNIQGRNNESTEWLSEQAIIISDKLAQSFSEKKPIGEEPFNIYPRMIRAFADSWGKDSRSGKYQSPIASFIHQYNIHRNSDNNHRMFKYLPIYIDGIEDREFDMVANCAKQIQNILGNIINEKKSEKIEYPTLDSLINDKKLQNTIFSQDIPDCTIGLLTNTEDKKAYKYSRFVLSLLFFTKYFTERVVFTTVTAHNEEYAFDMFESLNTTGEPLTAYETFKPRILKAEGIEKYEESISKKHVKDIESYLGSFEDPTKRKNATNKLLISFRLAETGEKLSKRLNEQRRFLKDSFDSLETIDKQRLFTQNLAHCALFIKNIWNEDSKDKAEINTIFFHEPENTLIALDLLKKTNHNITMPLLTRFYTNYICNNADTNSAHEFEIAARSIAAFSTLWRMTRSSTDNIDSYYRNLMKDGLDNILKPLHRYNKTSICFDSTAIELQNALKDILIRQGSVSSKEDFIKMANETPAYKTQEFAKFLFLVAAHETIPDSEKPGLIKTARRGVEKILNWENWTTMTIEHIAPKVRHNSTDWDPEIYANSTTIDMLGNLTLLPRFENAVVNNHSWDNKKIFYKIFCAQTQDEIQQYIQILNINISDETINKLLQAEHLSFIQSLTFVGEKWTFELVKQRTKNIASLAWDRIAPWLGF